MKIRLKATILFQTLLLLIFITPYLIKSGISRHILFPATLVTGIILASKSREAFKEYLNEQVRQERDTNFVVMYNVLILSLVILVLLSTSLALIVGKNGYSKNIVGFMVLLLLYVFPAFYSPVSFSRIVTIAVSLYTPHVLALELAGFNEMPIILVISAIFRVLLWVLGIKLALRIFKLKENGIDPVLPLFPLLYAGWILTIIRLIDYLYFPIYLRRGIEGFLIVGAWGLSFYLLGKRLGPYMGIIAYPVSFIIGLVLFMLLPPPFRGFFDLGSLRDFLGKPREEIPALIDLSFRVREGEIFGLLGPNGAGKTTLCKIANGLLEPSSGKLLIDGHDSFREHGKVASKMFTVFTGERDMWGIFQWRLSVHRNLKFIARLWKVPESEIGERIEYALKLLNLWGKRDEWYQKLSAGMKQKVYIASALVVQPRYLILDEPTVFLV